MKRLLQTAGCLLALATAAMAGPLDPAHVPQEAKWVMHLNYEALSDTALMEKLRDQRPEVVKQIRGWMQERYGIDPQEDLRGVTLFSDTYEAYSGAAILQADYDLDKVKSDLMSKEGVKETQWQDHTLYTWTAEKHRRQGNGDAAERGRGADAQYKEMGITAILLDSNTAIFAPSPDRAKSVVKLLQGDAPSLEGEDSKLIADIPGEAFFYGAAVDLKNIARRDEMFPILQQHEHIRWAIGERDGQLFEDVVFVAQNEEVASQMEQALQGFVALGKVWAGDAKELTQLYENVEITLDGSTVRVDWQGETDQVVAALGELRERVAQWGQAERARR